MAVLIYICSSKVFSCVKILYIYIYIFLLHIYISTERNALHTEMSAGCGNSVTCVLHANSPWAFAVSISVCPYPSAVFYVYLTPTMCIVFGSRFALECR